MKKIAIPKFKATCLAGLERVRKTGNPVLLTRFGEPMAELPPSSGVQAAEALGRFSGGNRSNHRRNRFSCQRRRRSGSPALMKLLLDTHIWVWSALDRARLSSHLTATLENPSNELWLSPISLWEVLTLCQKQRLTLHPNPQAWIANALDAVPMREAQITYQGRARERPRATPPSRPRRPFSGGHCACVRSDPGNRR